MNIRKPIDYSDMFKALDTLMMTALPQMGQYCEIGKLVSVRPEKGAAVAASEHLKKIYPDVSGFSPRNLRRMRDFYRAYENAPEILADAMIIGWTRNVVILENCETLEERIWYIRAVCQFNWSKTELLSKINDKVYLEILLDFTDQLCYTKKDTTTTKEPPSNAAAQDSQHHGTGSPGLVDRISTLLHLCHPQLLHRGVYTQPLLVRRWSGWLLGMADGTGPPGHGVLWQALRQEGQAGEPGVVFGSGQLSARRVRFRRTLQRRFSQPSGEACDRCSPHVLKGFETSDWVRQRRLERLRHRDDQSTNTDLCHSPQLRIRS